MFGAKIGVDRAENELVALICVRNNKCSFPNQAPDAEFSDKDSNKGAQSGIIQLLTQIKENLEGEVSLADKSEAKATEEYEAAAI